LELDSTEVVIAVTPSGEEQAGVLLTVDENDTRLEVKLNKRSVYGAGEIFVPLLLNAKEPDGKDWVKVFIKSGQYIGYSGYFRAWDSPSEIGLLNSH
jgi:hypothetical protein